MTSLTSSTTLSRRRRKIADDSFYSQKKSKCKIMIRVVSICMFAVLFNIGGCFGNAGSSSDGSAFVFVDKQSSSSNHDVDFNGLYFMEYKGHNKNFLRTTSPTSLARQKSSSLGSVGSSDLRGDKNKKKKRKKDNDAKKRRRDDKNEQKKKDGMKDNEEEEEVKRGGIRQLWARFRGNTNTPSSSTSQDKTDNDDNNNKNDKQESKRSRWRIFSRTSSDQQQQQQQQQTQTQTSKQKQEKDKILGPLNSEILLAAELKKEQQQRRQQQADISILPSNTPSSPSILPSFVDLEQNLKSARDTLAGVRTTTTDTTSLPSSTKSTEQERINQLRQEMERRRKEQELKKIEQKAKTIKERQVAAQKRDLLAKQRAKEEAMRMKKMKSMERTKALKKVAQGGTQAILNENGSDKDKQEQQNEKSGGGGLGAFLKSKFSNATSTAETTFEAKGATETDKNWGVGEYVSGVLTGVATAAQRTFRSNKNSNPNEEWIVVCPKIAVAPGVQVPVVAGGIDLLLVVSKDGKTISCVANTCPHLGTPLETGIIERRPREEVEEKKEGNNDGITKSKSLKVDPKNSTTSTNNNAVEIKDDGCEDCIVCPLHQTAFALDSGEVRGEWCPYPPVIGNVMGMVKAQSKLPTFKVRTRGKNVEVLINSSLEDDDDDENDDDGEKNNKKKKRKS